MILVGRKGKNTVQAFVIFRNVMDKGRSNVNQTDNDIKSAEGVRRGGEQCEGYVGRSQRRDLYAKKLKAGVNTEWGNR